MIYTTMIWYHCKCVYHEEGVLLCQVCREWADKVETAIVEHKLDDTTTIKCKRWVGIKAKFKELRRFHCEVKH